MNSLWMRRAWAGCACLWLAACGSEITNGKTAKFAVADADSPPILVDATIGEADARDETTVSPGISDVGPAPSDGPAPSNGTTGDRCDGPADCSSGWCVPVTDGSVCTETCTTECPADWRCTLGAGGTDPTYICVPPPTLVPPPTVVGDPSDPGEGDAIGGDPGEGDVVGGDPGQGDVVGGDVAGGDPSDVVAGGDVVGGDIGVTPDGGVLIPGDADGDGIPDDEDHIPCLGFYLEVLNEGVTSASLSLNNENVVPSSAFPTDDPIIVWLNPQNGENRLDLDGKLAGEPGDLLLLRVWDTTGQLHVEGAFLRVSGPPSEHSASFFVDVNCD